MSEPRFVVVLSDLHAGCQMALCPPTGATMDNGGAWELSGVQRKLWEAWRYFWDTWVPFITKGEPYYLVVNGDALEGVHHKATTQITQNMSAQIKIAHQLLKPCVDNAAEYFHIRGTDAHSGQEGCHEETLAQLLGATPNEVGQYARIGMNLPLRDKLINFMHHVGVSSAPASEMSALNAEFVDACVAAGRFGKRAPDAIVRSHRHANSHMCLPMANGHGIVMATAPWQVKTPWCYKNRGGRSSPSQYGGSIMFVDEYGDLDVKHCIWTVEAITTEDPACATRRTPAGTGKGARSKATS